MFFRIDYEKLLEKYRAIWTTIECLKNIKLKVYDDRCIKTKIRTFTDKVYANFCDLNMPEDDIEYESFTVISIDYLPVYESKYYLQVCLDNCVYNIVNRQMADYLMNFFLKIRYYKGCITIELI